MIFCSMVHQKVSMTRIMTLDMLHPLMSRMYFTFGIVYKEKGNTKKLSYLLLAILYLLQRDQPQQ